MKPNKTTLTFCILLVIFVILQAQITIQHRINVEAARVAQKHLNDIDRVIGTLTDKNDLQAFKTQIEAYVKKELEGYRLHEEMNRGYYKELMGK